MKLYVKEGREYVLGGKVYRGKEAVDGVPDKFARVLTGPKGPLEYETAALRATPTDLPAGAVRSNDITSLRQEYQEALGKRPFNGWDAATLRQKIGEYNRRDMRAE